MADQLKPPKMPKMMANKTFDEIDVADLKENYDSEFDYSDEYEEYEDEPQPQKVIPREPQKPLPTPPPPPTDQSKPVKKVKKVIKVNMKLRVGSKVEVYSNSRGQWFDGTIKSIKGKAVCVCYTVAEGKTHKWLEGNSKHLKPKLEKHNAGKRPTLNRKESIALKQKKPVKLKLSIGCPVEVFSVSNDRWIDGRLVGVKRDLIRIAYGKDFATEKWLRVNSEQFRPKLDMVDAAFLREKGGTQHDYSCIDHEEDVINRKDSNSRLGVYMTESLKGAYITHSLRREQYQEDSIQSIKGTGDKRGCLKIKVSGALQLKHNGNFAQVTVENYVLKTKKVASDQNPVWKELLKFNGFRPQIGKTAVVEVGNKNILKEKIVGRAEFELPIVFNRQEKMTIDITSSKKRLCGIVVLEQVVVDQGK